MAAENQNAKDPQDTIGKQEDSEGALQEELSREASEGADSIGDVRSNRTLSGSSTWETLPKDESDRGGSSNRKSDS